LPAAEGIARLFIAVWPPDEVVEQLLAIPRDDQRGVRFVRPENWHVTLRFFGDAEPDDVLDALAGVTLMSTRARVGPVLELVGRHALAVPVAGLDTLAETVNERTDAIGRPPRQRFAGHLTLARLEDGVRPRARGTAISAEFDVAEIALVQSRLGPHGARYETIHTWPVPAEAR
jgi:RNA 2',3'-cyclic 3'-phosphodiesterase